jgi:peroxiredoxin
MLADPDLQLAAALGLPTFTADGRLTLLVGGGRIEHAFYPVFPPDRHAREVLAWLRAHPG